MINHNGLKSDIIGAGKKIRRMGGLTNGEKLLLEEVLSLPENWQISWAWFARELKYPKSSIYAWRNELCKKGVWKVDKDDNVEFLLSIEPSPKTEPSPFFEQKSPKTEPSPKNGHIKKELQGLNFLKKEQKKESACVREIDNVECEISQDADKAHEIGQISENADLSAQISAVVAEFETSQTQENEQNAEIFCAGGENLTQINNPHSEARTAQRGEMSEQGSGAVVLGLQKIAFSSSEKPAKMSIGEAYANWQRQIQAAAEFSVKGENLAQNDSEDSTAWQGETSEANGTNADLPAPQTPLRTGGGLMENAALKTPKKQPKPAQTPEQTAAAMLEKHSEIAKSANFSDSEREAVLDYFAYKAEHKKHPLTERNSKAILKQCVKIKGENKDLPEIIERTIANGWADLRWVADKPAPSNNAWQKPPQNDWRATLARVRQRQAAEAARSV